jgi:DNA mismatch repair protein MutS
MRQYFDAKRQHRDAIVFFRMGDFYEMFYEDALVAAKALDLTLTSRSKDSSGAAIPMCGVPYHAVDTYLTRLVRKGFRVALCEQVEDPRKAKGLVRREVVRVVSPGTLTDSTYLDAREPAFLMSIVAIGIGLPTPAGSGESGAEAGPAPTRRRGERDGEQPLIGVALIDLSTGEFTAAEYAGTAGLQALGDEIAVLRPREIVVPVGSGVSEAVPEIPRLGIAITSYEPSNFELAAAEPVLLEQLRTQTLAGFGLDARPAATRAAGALVSYLRGTQRADLAHVRTIGLRVAAEGLVIDPVTLRHLEVLRGAEGGTDGSLLSEIDRTITAMGGRLLRAWLVRPLVALERIQERLDAVEDWVSHPIDRGRIRDALKAVQDLERLVARAALGTVGPRELVALGRSCAAIPHVKQTLEPLSAPLLRSLGAEIDALDDITDLIARTLVDEPPPHAREGGFTRDGVDPGLDELRGVSRSGRQIIAEMEERERARTGIGGLKVRFNRVFGYYIEVSRASLHAVPSDYQRKQTIAGGERFTTPALKEHEERILGADERILERELEIFESLRLRVAAEAARIQDTARALATLDVLAALAETAAVANYAKPDVHDGDELTVLDARHPVVERHVRDGFVPNDIDLDAHARQLVIVTGPNMGGKSTYLRQVALVPLLAQIGSFVPARQAKVSIVDRIFARVGASDNIARGQSTFMVEMQETAHILHAATSRSLVVLDEIGRGTATFDGLSIAWAVAEYLATNARARPKTLFATHYHELTDLADAVPGVVNAHVAAREWHDDIVFLRKIVPGRSDRSYGIQVARLAGLPKPVVTRAKEILAGLERDELSRGGRPTLSGSEGDAQTSQLGLFSVPPAGEVRDPAARHPTADVVTHIRDVDLDETSPRMAWDLLAALKRLVEES